MQGNNFTDKKSYSPYEQLVRFGKSIDKYQ